MSRSGELDRVRSVSLADDQPDQPDHSGVLMLRPRSLRWTNRFPKVPGFYWIRPNTARYSTGIHYVPGGLPEERFNDVEFSDRPISRPLEPEADDDAVLRELGPYPYTTYATDEQEEVQEISRITWFLWGLLAGVLLGVVAMIVLYIVVMGH